MDQASNKIDQPDSSAGNEILAHIFGSKDVSRQVADRAANNGGAPPDAVKALLPVAAAMVAKHVAANAGDGGIGNILKGIAGAAGSNRATGRTLDNILGGLR